jgi:hypothetical protein
MYRISPLLDLAYILFNVIILLGEHPLISELNPEREAHPEHLGVFSGIPEGTYDSFRQNLADNPDLAEELYRSFVRANPRLAVRILQGAHKVDDEDSYWNGVNSILGVLSAFAAGQLLDRLMEPEAS